MGEVYTPEDIARGRDKPSADFIRPPLPQPTSVAVLSRELASLKHEIAKIKQALAAHGINIE